MAVAKKEEKATVVAELTVSWPGGSETVKSFDRSWRRQMALAVAGHLPVSSKLNGFVRKD